MFRFASPWFFLILLLLPLSAYLQHRGQRWPLLEIPTVTRFRSITRSGALKLMWVMPVLKYTALILMVVALARPQWGTRRVDILTEGINIILAVDVSESMAALDFKREGKIVNRLEAVRGVIHDFIGKRDGDRIGLVVFGTHAYTQVPMTRDYDTIDTILERVEIGAAGKSTAIGDAIGISLKRLRDVKSPSSVIILLTDGRSNTGALSPAAAAEVAAQRGVKVYTIGVGTKGRVPFRVRHPLMGERYVYQQVDIDEETLKAIAQKTGGAYFRAENTKGLTEIYSTIDAMEKSRVKTRTHAEYREYYLYFLLPAFTCLVLWSVLANTRYLRVP